MKTNELAGNQLLVKSPQAAAMLAMSPRKLWSLTASHEIPHVRIGRAVRYSVAELTRWIDSRMQESSTNG